MHTTKVLGMATAWLAASVAGVWGDPDGTQTSVGTITVCYYAVSCPYTQDIGLTSPVDSPAFEITNSGKIAITKAVFKIERNRKNEVAKDSFLIGKIAAGARVVIVPGYSNDHSSKHPPGSFFSFTGSPLDTSEASMDADSIKFTFSGRMGQLGVGSGVILTRATAGQSNDGTVKHINFLGGPNNVDGPCDDCFGPKHVATLTAQ